MARFGRGYPIQPKRLRPIQDTSAVAGTASLALSASGDTQAAASGTASLSLSAAQTPATLAYSDDFNRSTLGTTNWSQTAGPAFALSGNQAVGGSATLGGGAARWNTAITGSQAVRATWVGGSLSGIAFAMPAFADGAAHSTAGDWYVFFGNGPGGTYYLARKFNSGTSLVTIINTGITSVAGDVIEANYDGTTVTCYVNGGLVLTTNPSSPLSVSSNPYVGMHQGVAGNNGTAVLDDWSGGSPALYAGVAAVATASASVTLTASGNAQAPDSGSASLSLSGTATPSFLGTGSLSLSASGAATGGSTAASGTASLALSASGTDAPAFSFTDSFDQPDGALSANWLTTATPMTVGSNAVVSGAAVSAAEWATAAAGYPVFAEATYRGGSGVGLCVAMPSFTTGAALSTTGAWYVFNKSTAGGSTVLVKKESGNTVFTAQVSGGPDVTAGDRMRIEYDGTTITAKINGVTVMTYVPSAPLSGQYGVGMIYRVTTGSVTILDNWAGGQFTPTSLSLSASANTQAVAAGSASVALSASGSAQTPVGVPFSDTFQRADGSLGSNWVTSGASPLQIGSGAVASQAAAAIAYWATATTGAFQFSQATYKGGTGPQVSVAMPSYAQTTALSSIGSFYAFRRSTAGGSTVLVQKQAASGSYTTLASGGTDVTAGDVMRLDYDGATLIAKINGTTIFTNSPATPLSTTTQPYVGIGYGSTTATTILDDWSGGVGVAGAPVLSLTGSLSGKAPDSGSASLTLSASGAAQAPGSGSATVSLTSSGGVVAATSGTGSLALTGSMTPDASPVSGSASLTLSGVMVPKAPVTGSAVLTLDGTGIAINPQVGTGSLLLAASGTAEASATGGGALSLTGSLSGKAPDAGSATLALTGSASLTVPNGGLAALALSASGAARTPVSGSCFITLSGTVNAQAPDAATASLGLSAAASARATGAGAATLGLNASGAAQAKASGSLASLSLVAATTTDLVAMASAQARVTLSAMTGQPTVGLSPASGSLTLTAIGRVTALATGPRLVYYDGHAVTPMSLIYYDGSTVRPANLAAFT